MREALQRSGKGIDADHQGRVNVLNTVLLTDLRLPHAGVAIVCRGVLGQAARELNISTDVPGLTSARH